MKDRRLHFPRWQMCLVLAAAVTSLSACRGGGDGSTFVPRESSAGAAVQQHVAPPIIQDSGTANPNSCGANLARLPGTYIAFTVYGKVERGIFKSINGSQWSEVKYTATNEQPSPTPSIAPSSGQDYYLYSGTYKIGSQSGCAYLVVTADKKPFLRQDYNAATAAMPNFSGRSYRTKKVKSGSVLIKVNITATGGAGTIVLGSLTGNLSHGTIKLTQRRTPLSIGVTPPPDGTPPPVTAATPAATSSPPLPSASDIKNILAGGTNATAYYASVVTTISTPSPDPSAEAFLGVVTSTSSRSFTMAIGNLTPAATGVGSYSSSSATLPYTEAQKFTSATSLNVDLTETTEVDAPSGIQSIAPGSVVIVGGALSGATLSADSITLVEPGPRSTKNVVMAPATVHRPANSRSLIWPHNTRMRYKPHDISDGENVVFYEGSEGSLGQTAPLPSFGLGQCSYLRGTITIGAGAGNAQTNEWPFTLNASEDGPIVTYAQGNVTLTATAVTHPAFPNFQYAVGAGIAVQIQKVDCSGHVSTFSNFSLGELASASGTVAGPLSTDTVTLAPGEGTPWPSANGVVNCATFSVSFDGYGNLQPIVDKVMAYLFTAKLCPLVSLSSGKINIGSLTSQNALIGSSTAVLNPAQSFAVTPLSTTPPSFTINGSAITYSYHEQVKLYLQTAFLGDAAGAPSLVDTVSNDIITKPQELSWTLDSSVAPTSAEFNFTGAPQSFTVPNDVTSISVSATGAGMQNPGGSVNALIPVTPGETLWVYVGGYTENSSGGYNGGGQGGADGDSLGGGGASDVRENGKALSNRVIVAGGAGGNGGFGNEALNGIGGGGGGCCAGANYLGDIIGTTDGVPGGGVFSAWGSSYGGGDGATYAANGAGGVGSFLGSSCNLLYYSGNSGTAGSGGTGGNAGDGVSASYGGSMVSSGGGGGGGGGYFGGGGGASGGLCATNLVDPIGDDNFDGGGGGGGSSYVEATGSGATFAPGCSDYCEGSVQFAWTYSASRPKRPRYASAHHLRGYASLP